VELAKDVGVLVVDDALPAEEHAASRKSKHPHNSRRREPGNLVLSLEKIADSRYIYVHLLRKKAGFFLNIPSLA